MMKRSEYLLNSIRTVGVQQNQMSDKADDVGVVHMIMIGDEVLVYFHHEIRVPTCGIVFPFQYGAQKPNFAAGGIGLPSVP